MGRLLSWAGGVFKPRRRGPSPMELKLLRGVDELPQAYGFTLAVYLHQRQRQSVDILRVHDAMRKLTHQGVVTAELADPTPERGGRRKLIYSLTELGRAMLKVAAWNEEWNNGAHA